MPEESIYQNRCHRKVSPPLVGSKNVVFMLWSVSNIAIPVAKTGGDRSWTAVIRTNQVNKGVSYWDVAGGFALM